MKIYRVHKLADHGSSAGYQYFSSRREAEQFARAYRKSEDEATSVMVIEVEPTRTGILLALNAFASHADNG